MEQNVSAVIVALDAHLEQLKERCVLRDESVGESRRLGRGVSGIFASEEGDRRFGDTRMIPELQADVVRRSYFLQRRVPAGARLGRSTTKTTKRPLASVCTNCGTAVDIEWKGV